MSEVRESKNISQVNEFANQITTSLQQLDGDQWLKIHWRPPLEIELDNWDLTKRYVVTLLGALKIPEPDGQIFNQAIPTIQKNLKKVILQIKAPSAPQPRRNRGGSVSISPTVKTSPSFVALYAKKLEEHGFNADNIDWLLEEKQLGEFSSFLKILFPEIKANADQKESIILKEISNLQQYLRTPVTAMLPPSTTTNLSIYLDRLKHYRTIVTQLEEQIQNLQLRQSQHLRQTYSAHRFGSLGAGLTYKPPLNSEQISAISKILVTRQQEVKKYIEEALQNIIKGILADYANLNIPDALLRLVLEPLSNNSNLPAIKKILNQLLGQANDPKILALTLNLFKVLNHIITTYDNDVSIYDIIGGSNLAKILANQSEESLIQNLAELITTSLSKDERQHAYEALEILSLQRKSRILPFLVTPHSPPLSPDLKSSFELLKSDLGENVHTIMTQNHDVFLALTPDVADLQEFYFTLQQYVTNLNILQQLSGHGVKSLQKVVANEEKITTTTKDQLLESLNKQTAQLPALIKKAIIERDRPKALALIKLMTTLIRYIPNIPLHERLDANLIADLIICAGCGRVLLENEDFATFMQSIPTKKLPLVFTALEQGPVNRLPKHLRSEVFLRLYLIAVDKNQEKMFAIENILIGVLKLIFPLLEKELHLSINNIQYQVGYSRVLANAIKASLYEQLGLQAVLEDLQKSNPQANVDKFRAEFQLRLEITAAIKLKASLEVLDDCMWTNPEYSAAIAEYRSTPDLKAWLTTKLSTIGLSAEKISSIPKINNINDIVEASFKQTSSDTATEALAKIDYWMRKFKVPFWIKAKEQPENDQKSEANIYKLNLHTRVINALQPTLGLTKPGDEITCQTVTIDKSIVELYQKAITIFIDVIYSPQQHPELQFYASVLHQQIIPALDKQLEIYAEQLKECKEHDAAFSNKAAIKQ